MPLDRVRIAVAELCLGLAACESRREKWDARRRLTRRLERDRLETESS